MPTSTRVNRRVKMAIRTLRYAGDEILKKQTREVEKIDEKIVELVNDMIETMHKYNGVGLAAPQVGILKRIAVIDLYEEGDRTSNFNKSAHIRRRRETNS